ncbi:MAG TPA: hypothetical protein VH351_19165 [Bryobacteraceae bacterium]|nr:hypothetical protein [Bryobacteraceae bacterium]
MASVKSADLIKSCTKAAATLDTGIKKSLGKDVDSKDLKDLQSVYKQWKDLLAEAQKKASKWDEDDKDEDKFNAFLKSQMADARGYEADLKKIDQQVSDGADTEKRLKSALLEANNFYRVEVHEKLDEVHDALTQTQMALVRELPKAIDFQFQRAGKILTKEFMNSLTAAGVEKELKQIAAKHKVALRDLEADKRLEAFTVGQGKRARELDGVMDGLRDRAKAFEQEMKEKEAESSNKNASPEYRANLNKLLKTYKEAYGELKKNLSEIEGASEELDKLKGFIGKAAADELSEAASKAGTTAENVFSALNKLEKQTDATFSDGIYRKKLEKYSMTPEDINKFFKPLQAKVLSVAERAGTARASTKGDVAAIVKLLQKPHGQLEPTEEQTLTKSIRSLNRLAST